MPDGLLEVTVAVLARNVALADEARPLVGIVAAGLSAALASHASRRVTDRVIAWRRRADQDEL